MSISIGISIGIGIGISISNSISISISINIGIGRRLLNTLEHFLTMFDNSIVNKTSPEANWNRQTNGKDHALSKFDALTKKEDKNMILKKEVN